MAQVHIGLPRRELRHRPWRRGTRSEISIMRRGLSGACIEGYSTIFHTDARQVQAWGKFRFIDQGNCTYAIQTASGFYVGIYKDSSGRTLY